MVRIEKWTKKTAPNGTVLYTRKGAKVGELGIITIQKTPKLNMRTMKVIGHTYSLTTNVNKTWERFTSLKKATERANAIMRASNNFYPSGKMTKCAYCKKDFPEEFGGVYCPRCEDLAMEAREMEYENARERGELE